VGWGTDIGGSVRIPAANQGVYGLRPSVRIFVIDILVH
jgi:Asp-tRNA(Asn)/Glu-tRNA(Gln) amidotransferase A subunit family amidase